MINKRLYKSIINDISKTVKRHINEDLYDDLYEIDQENDLTTDITDNVYDNKSNIFHMDFSVPGLLDNLNIDLELLKLYNGSSEKELCKFFTFLFSHLSNKYDLNKITNITVVNVLNIFRHDENEYEYSDLRLEIKNLKEANYKKFYNIMDRLDGRDDCYYADFWFHGTLDSTDNLKFIKWLFDNITQKDDKDKILTFKDFLTLNYLRK